MKLIAEYTIDNVKYGLKKPSRREVKESEIVFSSELGKAVSRGFLTREMLINKYLDQGGILSNIESKQFESARYDYFKVQEEYLRINGKKKQTAKDKERLEELENEMMDKKDEFSSILYKQENLFQHTAEVWARNETIVWLFLNLFVYKPKNENEYRLFFDNPDEDDNLDRFDEILENKDKDAKLYEAVSKGQTIITIWFINRGLSEEEIKEISSNLTDNNDDESVKQAS